MIQRIASLFKSKKENLLAELQSLQPRITETENRLAAYKARLSDAENDLSLGPSLQRRIAIEADVKIIAADAESAERDLIKLRAERDLARSHLARLEREEAHEAELERKRSIPRLRQQYADHVARAEHFAAELGNALRDQAETGRLLGRALELADADNDFLPSRIMARHFILLRYLGTVPPPEGGGIPPVRFLQEAPKPGTQAEVAAGLGAKEKTVLTERASFFAGRREAEAARDDIDPTGKLLHVVQDQKSQLWTIRRGTLRYELMRPLSEYPQPEGNTP